MSRAAWALAFEDVGSLRVLRLRAGDHCAQEAFARLYRKLFRFIPDIDALNPGKVREVEWTQGGLFYKCCCPGVTYSLGLKMSFE